tara:strand:- start:184 stop:855 length:672 start_codon:yes stop_codon:yes gene_type:complete
MTNQNLIIFDVDGTLIESMGIDTKVYAETFLQSYNTTINTDWNRYRYSTDSGIFLELFNIHFQKSPSIKDEHIFKTLYFTNLNTKLKNNIEACQPVTGIADLLCYLSSLENFDLAIATGCWQTAAKIKLKFAKLATTNFVMASSDDNIYRHKIIELAHARARKQNKITRYNKITYVGDKIWDYEASCRLGINFIGLGNAFNSRLAPHPVIYYYDKIEFIEAMK